MSDRSPIPRRGPEPIDLVTVGCARKVKQAAGHGSAALILRCNAFEFDPGSCSSQRPDRDTERGLRMRKLIILAVCLGLVSAASVAVAGEPLQLYQMWLQQERLLQDFQQSGTGLALTPTLRANCRNGNQFADNRLYYLDSFNNIENNGFDKQTPPVYTGPTFSDKVPAGTQVYSDIVAAFNAAPAFFKVELCKLTAVLIDGRGTDAPTVVGYDWGFWEAPDQRTRGKVGNYIALVGWSSPLSDLATYEADLTNAVASVSEIKYTTRPSGNTKILTLLSNSRMKTAMWFGSRVELRPGSVAAV